MCAFTVVWHTDHKPEILLQDIFHSIYTQTQKLHTRSKKFLLIILAMAMYVFRGGSEKGIRHVLLRLSKAKIIQEHSGLCSLCPYQSQSQLTIKSHTVKKMFKHSPYLYQCILMPIRHWHNVKKPSLFTHEPQNNFTPKYILQLIYTFHNKHG
jgi:hypothetical protein